MSTQQIPLTYEGVLELFRQSDKKFERMVEASDKRREERDREFQETERVLKETVAQVKETSEQIKATERAVKETRLAVEATERSVEAAVEAIQQSISATNESISATNVKIGALDSRVGEMVEKLVGEGNLVAQFRELGHNVKTHSRHKVFGKRGTAGSGEIDLFMEDGDIAILVEVKTTLKMDHVIEHIERIEKYRRFVDADPNNGKRFVGAVAGTVIAENVIDFAHDNGLYVIIQSARAVEIIAQPEGFVVKKW